MVAKAGDLVPNTGQRNRARVLEELLPRQKLFLCRHHASVGHTLAVEFLSKPLNLEIGGTCLIPNGSRLSVGHGQMITYR